MAKSKGKKKVDLMNANTYKKQLSRGGSKSNQRNSVNNERGIINYFKGVRQELKKVVWLERDELIADTVIVFLSVAFFALLFWGIDTGFLAGLKQVLNINM